MDSPSPAPDPAKENRQLLWGIIATVVGFLIVIALFTLLLMRAGGSGNYYDQSMSKPTAAPPTD